MLRIPGNTVSGGTVFANISNGTSGRIRCDVDGRVWSSAGDGVHIFAPDDHLIGKIRFGRTSNLCFGGPGYKTLHMAGQPVVASIPVRMAGIPSVKKPAHQPTAGGLKRPWHPRHRPSPEGLAYGSRGLSGATPPVRCGPEDGTLKGCQMGGDGGAVWHPVGMRSCWRLTGGVHRPARSSTPGYHLETLRVYRIS